MFLLNQLNDVLTNARDSRGVTIDVVSRIREPQIKINLQFLFLSAGHKSVSAPFSLIRQ